MISRRTFLLGAASTVAVGAIGVEVVGPRKALHAVGLVSSPDHHVPASNWPVVTQELQSAFMPKPVTWAMAVPPGGAKGVLLCLHGRNGDHTAAFENEHLHDVAASLGLPLAIVSVDGDHSAYWHPRKDGRDPMSMVFQELLPLVDTTLNASLPRAVIGWSMGGYGALLFGEQHPQYFRAVVAASPALWHSFGQSSGGAFDDADDYAKHDVFAHREQLSMLRVRVDCGTDDGFLGAAKDFAKGLPAANLGRFSAGFHDGAYWRSVAPAQLTMIGEALGLPASPRATNPTDPTLTDSTDPAPTGPPPTDSLLPG